MGWLIVIGLGLPLTVTGDSPPEPNCAGLLEWRHAGAEIVSAETVPLSDDLPEHCRVEGKIDSGIGFQMHLPDHWNGKFYMVGNGGYLGAFFDQSNGLVRGYATASTDTGHRGPDPAFAHDNRQAEIDFAYRAVHLTAVTAKRVIEHFYGSPPQRSYFRGCSTGGRQGLMEAQRYPEDFDGLSIGAPIYDYTDKQIYNAAWVAQALFARPESYMPRRKLAALGSAVYDRCDAMDGLEDGLIDDPRRCDFDPHRDLERCTEADADDCFTAGQVEAIARIYDGPGGGSYPGHVVGGERMPAPGEGLSGGWDVYFTGSRADDPVEDQAAPDRDAYGGNDFEPVQLRNARSFFKYLAFEQDRPDFEVLTDLDFDAVPDTSFMAAMMNADNPDLSDLHRRGGKILLWHGWADVGLNPLRTIDYYDRVRKAVGAERADEMIRLFMLPGVYHCSGGPGADRFDDLGALEKWVEKGIAPERLTAARRTVAPFAPGRGPGGMATPGSDSEIVFTRPLCAYPLVARYRGTGSVDAAENFLCTPPEPPVENGRKP